MHIHKNIYGFDVIDATDEDVVVMMEVLADGSYGQEV